MLGKVEVVEDGTGGHDCGVHAVETEAFERCRAELLAQALVGGIECEKPVFKFEAHILLREFCRCTAF